MKNDIPIKQSKNYILDKIKNLYPDLFRIESGDVYLKNRTLDHYVDNQPLLLDDDHTFCIILRSVTRTLDHGPLISIILDLYDVEGHFEMGQDLELKPDICATIYNSGLDINYINDNGLTTTYDKEAIMRRWTIENIIK